MTIILVDGRALMQCVILAGGLGTRMRPLTETCPKTLLPAAGRPFAWHQMQWLAREGVTEAVYSIGHQGELIRHFWENEPWPMPSIRYVDEGPKLLGTGGALKLAFDEGVLRERFLLIYGDSYLPIPFGPVWRAVQETRKPALMTVLRNEGRWDRSNVIFDRGRVLLYDKNPAPDVRAKMEYIDYGLFAFRRDVLSDAPHGPFDLATLLHDLSLSDQLAGFEVTERFYEIGSPAGLRDFEEYLEAHQAR
jgi:NDP-sugar pyrophosphorylase family protein